jgi:ATP-dependent RNA helicase RhlE
MSEETTSTDTTPSPTPKKYYDFISIANRTKQDAYFVQQHDKNRMIQELLVNAQQTLIVVKNKRSGDTLKEFLNELSIDSLCIHGNHRISQIEEGQNAFNTKECSILITTDRTLEKIGLLHVEKVISYDLPREHDDYFTRLRLVDETGEAVSLIDPDDEKTLLSLELFMRCVMNEQEIEGFEHSDYVAPLVRPKKKKPRHKKTQKLAKKEGK